jgi:hypothetical protein
MNKKEYELKLLELRHHEQSIKERIRDIEWNIEQYGDKRGNLIDDRIKAMDKQKYIKAEILDVELKLKEME